MKRLILLGLCGVLLSLAFAGGARAQSAAALTTDYPDYLPGQTAVLTGAGFIPGEPINLDISIQDPDTGGWIPNYDWTDGYADDQGGFVCLYLVPEEAFGCNLMAVATGGESGLVASVEFSDGQPHRVVFATTGLPAGVAITVNCTYTNSGGQPNKSYTVTFSSPGPSAGNNGVVDAYPGTAFTYSGFPASVTLSGITYTLAGSSPASGFTTGAAGETTTVTATYAAPSDTTPPVLNLPSNMTAEATSEAGATVTYSVTATDPDDAVTEISVNPSSGSVFALGTTTVNCSATDSHSNTATGSFTVTVKDTIRPEVTGYTLGGDSSGDWFTSDVVIGANATDSGSGVASIRYSLDGENWVDALTLTNDGIYTIYVTVTDRAGNIRQDSATVQIDKTAPSIEGRREPLANSFGWNNSSVIVSFTGEDGGSGLASVSDPTTLTSEGAAQSVTGVAADAAGHTAAATVSDINIDLTAPTISGAPDRAANAAGWYNADVTVQWTTNDALSGLDPATVPVGSLVSGEGSNLSASASVSDKAGNSAHAEVSGLNIDKTAPGITGSRTPAANAFGWNNTDVVVSFEATDGLSGVALVTAPVTVSGEGADQSVTGTATDSAGNPASATVSSISIDKTAPTITGSRTPSANAYGWNGSAVTVSFTAEDGLSGIASVSDPTTLSDEGADQSVAGTATDKAGNPAGTTVTGINIDLTQPTVTGAATASPNADGWYNGDVTIQWAVSDSLSGPDPAKAPTDSLITGEGDNLSASVAGYDKAGNSKTSTVSGIKIDRTPPTISSECDGKIYLLNQNVSAVWAAQDSLSGIDDGSETTSGLLAGNALDTTTVGDHSFTVSATDRAGNTRTVTIAYHVHYAFVGNGFLPPIMANGQGLFKLGSTVPVKFQLADANGNVVTPASGFAAYIVAQKASSVATGTSLEAPTTDSPTSGLYFRYDPVANQFIYNLSTKQTTVAAFSDGDWYLWAISPYGDVFGKVSLRR